MMVTALLVPPTKGLILCVEDDDITRELISSLLQRQGYETVSARNGKEALAWLEEATPDLIISDINMPEVNGIELLARVRDNKETHSIPVMMLTSSDTGEELTTVLDLGADDYLLKPFDMKELIARVEAKIERPPV